jgi:hypothetical protein
MYLVAVKGSDNSLRVRKGSETLQDAPLTVEPLSEGRGGSGAFGAFPLSPDVNSGL